MAIIVSTTGIGCNCMVSNMIALGVLLLPKAFKSQSSMHLYLQLVISTDYGSLVRWGSEIKKSPPIVSYQDIMASEEGIKHWTSKIVLDTRIALLRFD